MGIRYCTQGWASGPEKEGGGSLVGHEKRNMWSEGAAGGKSELEGLCRFQGAE